MFIIFVRLMVPRCSGFVRDGAGATDCEILISSQLPPRHQSGAAGDAVEGQLTTIVSCVASVMVRVLLVQQCLISVSWMCISPSIVI